MWERAGLIGLCARRASTHMKIINPKNALIETLRHHVSGAIERGEKEAIVEMGVALLNEEMHAASIQDEIRQAKDKAADLGERAGKNAAEWVAQDTWGGRVTRGEKESASEFLRALDDGDLDLIANPPNLSGEWADSETPASLMCAVFGVSWEETPEFVDAQDEVCAAWEIAAQDAFFSSLSYSAQSVLS